MPYANYADKLAAMRAYSKTPAGKAAKQRSHANYVNKRRDMGRRADLQINPAPLAQALTNWNRPC